MNILQFLMLGNTLLIYKKTIESEWIFPSPIDETKSRNPPAVRKRLQLIPIPF